MSLEHIRKKFKGAIGGQKHPGGQFIRTTIHIGKDGKRAVTKEQITYEEWLALQEEDPEDAELDDEDEDDD